LVNGRGYHDKTSYFYTDMDCTSTRLPYRQTGAFTKIVLDYIDQSPALRSFFAYPPTVKGIQKAIEARKQLPANLPTGQAGLPTSPAPASASKAGQAGREVLVNELKKQYGSVETSELVKKNIKSLLSPETFTVTTAHQNNIFTGPLYFIYKIIHAIKLADHLKVSLPQQHFVPVFYIGSEDADLAELNHIHLGGEKLVWETKQGGAVGRMKVDKELLKLIDRMEGQLLVQPFGKEIITLVRECYKLGNDIQTATFKIVNALFAEYGLIVLLPDNAALKKQMLKIFEDDLLHQTASGIMEKMAENLQDAGYKMQAKPREINLFYLKDNLRERIEKKNIPRLNDTVGQEYSIFNSQYSFNEAELLTELNDHPERFSPNVILRGLYQETILPNIAFIGGGSELAYWPELKDLFAHYHVPYPALVLRNSFLIVEKQWQDRISKLGFIIEDFFLSEQELVNRLVVRETGTKLQFNGTFSETEKMYGEIKKQAAAVDITLEKHVDSLKLQSLHRLQELEKKMLRAEKRKFTDQLRQIHTIKEHLFPGNGLQERHENLSYYYAKWGREFIQKLFEHSLGLEQEFVVINEK